MTNTLGTQRYPTYLDVDEQVKPYLQMAATDRTWDFLLQLVTDACCTEAQRFIGAPIAPTRFGPDDGLGKFDGSGGLNSGYIMLPRIPVVEVVEVIEWTGQNPVTLPEITDPSGAGGSDGFQVNYRTGRLTRVMGGIWNRPFMPGSNNIWVTWVAGYNPIPADIVWATLDWVAHVFRNTQQTVTNRPGVQPSQEYEPSTFGDLWAGIPDRIVTVLESYIRVGIR